MKFVPKAVEAVDAERWFYNDPRSVAMFISMLTSRQVKYCFDSQGWEVQVDIYVGDDLKFEVENGDWLIIHPDGSMEVKTDSSFRAIYREE